MKRALALALALVLVLAALPLAASARKLTDAEKKIFAELRVPTQTDDGAFTLTEETIREGENYQSGDTIPELTQAQFDGIMAEIAKAKDEVRAAKTGNVKKWSRQTKDNVLACIDRAAQYINLRASGGTDGEKAETTVATITRTGDGATRTFDLSQNGVKPKSVTSVKVNGVAATDFTYDSATGILTFATAPAEGATIVNQVVKANSAGSSGYGYIRVYNPVTGETLAAEDHLVTTGSDLHIFAIVGACGLFLLCACVFVSKKAKLF